MIEIGKKAPNFSVVDQNDKETTLKNFEGKWVVLYFYPKDDTPGCTIEGIEFTAQKKSFDKLNSVVVGVSPDSTESHCKFIAKQNLGITLLSDPTKKLLKDYDAFGKKMLYGKEVEGVLRSTVLIDPAGKVAFHWPKVKAEGHALEVLEKLKELQ
jgi:thioredoxin-dependent peroxiredoxin